MKSYDARFEQLLNVFGDLIEEECTIFQGKLPKGELHSTALVGLFYADITYKKGISDFETYVRDSIHEALKHFITKSYFPQNWVSYHKKINKYKSRTEFIAFFKSPKVDQDLHIMIADFISGLKGPLKSIARELLGNATLEDIMSDNHLSVKAVKQYLLDMRSKWEAQYGKYANLYDATTTCEESTP